MLWTECPYCFGVGKGCSRCLGKGYIRGPSCGCCRGTGDVDLARALAAAEQERTLRDSEGAPTQESHSTTHTSETSFSLQSDRVSTSHTSGKKISFTPPHTRLNPWPTVRVLAWIGIPLLLIRGYYVLSHKYSHWGPVARTANISLHGFDRHKVDGFFIAVPHAWKATFTQSGGSSLWQASSPDVKARALIEYGVGEKPVKTYAMATDAKWEKNARKLGYTKHTYASLSALSGEAFLWDFSKRVGARGLIRRQILYFNYGAHHGALILETPEAEFSKYEDVFATIRSSLQP